MVIGRSRRGGRREEDVGRALGGRRDDGRKKGQNKNRCQSSIMPEKHGPLHTPRRPGRYPQTAKGLAKRTDRGLLGLGDGADVRSFFPCSESFFHFLFPLISFWAGQDKMKD